MRATFVVVTTLLTLPALVGLEGCAEDAILKRAREAEEAKAAPAGAEEPLAGAARGGAAAPGAPPLGEGARPPGVAPDPPKGDPGVPPPGSEVQTKVEAGDPTRVQAPEPARGIPVEPKPAPEGAPGGGPAGSPGGAPPKPGDPGAPPPITGPTVVVSGVVVYPGWSKGEVRIDVFDGDHTVHGTHPGVIASARLKKPGAFSVSVPEGAGKVYVEAVIDEDLDGKPGPQDPMGTAERYPVTVGTSTVSGLTVELVKHAPPGGERKKGDF